MSKLKSSGGLQAGALALLLLVSCASGPDDVFRSPGPGADVIVAIDNRDFSDATIYAYWSGFKTRVGIIMGKSAATFPVEWRGEKIQLEADFVGVGHTWSDVIDIYPGDELSWVIHPQW